MRFFIFLFSDTDNEEITSDVCSVPESLAGKIDWFNVTGVVLQCGVLQYVIHVVNEERFLGIWYNFTSIQQQLGAWQQTFRC